ncbi:heavy metal translocating P-type ATPase metal-binding domain-containing protein [Maribacter sp. PR1]|uniref:Heavy metal translocating P-type ATPase metal-binding domain-containing protein n=1 Tax=Maribacter cobaltidurans TaxID=1178778 RepID=A0ABU7IPL5_9FLAO|nr:MULTISPECIES: heavy metal translocating P-type ATPase metal-binding domain-containing protein [Maribacter]MDC6387499.1 heavy metal translocating P-type ATPase metal-binding domain-containing protein [Maribacter sp. PR1]MEE1974886.1 heavy metal translocating P-type ATPase metal-binding domain-containing protein [Maribacter cobaltidurans]
MEKQNCYHCGDDCGSDCIEYDQKCFCCNGCKTVYEIFSENNLSYYYDLQSSAGSTPAKIEGKYDFLETESIVERLTEFNDGNIQIVNLYIPLIHCSSCIWILENMNKLNLFISSSQVNFSEKTVRITYNCRKTTLKEVVLLLAKIGYEPYISLEDFDGKKKQIDRSLIYKLGVAGFAFGNVMFLSFPEYFDLNSSEAAGGEFWLNQYQSVFRWLMFAFSLPVVFYAGSDYFISAYKGLRSKILNIDVPIALGVLVLFLRSTLEIIFDWGSGFFDSLTGLVFFLLLGKFFQQKTYSFLSFERDYKSYFPIAVTRINKDGKEESTQVHEIKQGDRLLIRNEELIPVDGVLFKGRAQIDYSFVTGESVPVEIEFGDKVFAGGRQMNGSIEVEALKSVSQSYLTQLWSNSVFKTDKSTRFQTITDSIGKRFTVGVLTVAFLATFFWLFQDPSRAMNVFTAVLIIACPCAIALASPFTLGNMLRIFGQKKFYLRDTNALEQLARVDTAIFDKTGTITTAKRSTATYEGMPLTQEEESLLKNTLRASNHPLSRTLYDILSDYNIITLDDYEEHLGKGLEGSKGDKYIKIGSSEFVGNMEVSDSLNTAVHVASNNSYKGKYVFHNEYREGVSKVFEEMSDALQLAILSGDNEGEKANLEKLLPKLTPLYFNQKPEDKLAFITSLQDQGKKVLMVGDGLNDAGALAQAEVGIAISENINVFSPACDGIMDASKFKQLYQYIVASKKAMKIIKLSFLLSLLYNVVGLYFAVTGQLEPVIAAILMPLSSISVVVFTTVMTNLLGRKLD